MSNTLPLHANNKELVRQHNPFNNSPVNLRSHYHQHCCYKKEKGFYEVRGPLDFIDVWFLTFVPADFGFHSQFPETDQDDENGNKDKLLFLENHGDCDCPGEEYDEDSLDHRKNMNGLVTIDDVFSESFFPEDLGLLLLEHFSLIVKFLFPLLDYIVWLLEGWGQEFDFFGKLANKELESEVGQLE